ncbi:poly-beta-1,6 N-acetyl-D-glucosamine export porin PgaA [Ventosimonas gracilis]|uniref:Poly-beta-1,6 N-acetyl-D-glucosamine export porin PgaA n=1 Tax=Ventosimonas gracilis TaxID=1680762 RepID=A0A139SVM9_9GAMM|nr:poly-beta-1,6 N-acetyl-D-glucosamine export porin PgaA [Ventosimonas gracilis]
MPPFPVFADSEDDYDNLIRRARAGDTAPALHLLRQMGTTASLQKRFDHILIASWDNRPAEVLDVYQRLPKQVALPAAVQIAAARAWRDQKRWTQSLAIWRAGLHQHPEQQATFAAGLIMTLNDAGQSDDAINNGQYWVKRLPQSSDLRLALAYAYNLQNRPFDALYQADKALQLAQQAPWVQSEYVRSLQRAGLPEQALEHARKYPGRFTAAQMRALEGDAAAVQTRLAAMPSRSESERFVIADRVLARYDQLMKAWQRLGGEAAADLRRIRVDRLSALHARVRMQEVVDEYEKLHAEGVQIPVWALSNVASAYLYIRKPEQARDLYRAVLAVLEADNGNGQVEHEDSLFLLENRTGLYYALTETEEFEQIPPLLARMESSQAPSLVVSGAARPPSNPLYLDTRIVAAQASLYADDTPDAQQKMESMLQNAPNNTALYTGLAGVYQARLQPRKAERQLKLAETLEPTNLAVETEQGFVALDLQEWRQAEELSQDTIHRYPENLQARRLARLWAVQNMAELRISGWRGLASDSPVSGSGGFGIDAVLYSSPLDYNWRVFGGVGYAEGKYEEGHGYYNWQRAGVEWRSRDWWVEGEVSSNRYGYGAKPGLRLSTSYDLDDYWQIGGEVAQRSRETPLRALRSNIYSNAVDSYVRWRANERREWRLGFSPTHFSDDNNRWSLNLDGNERVYTKPHLKLDLLFGAYTQYNSGNEDRPYFNPKSDLMLLPGLRATHILNRRYENVWEQFATLSAGAYNQQGEGSDGVLGLSYGQRYRHNDVLEIGASLNALSRPYDGERENELSLSFDLNYRF